MNKTTTWSLHWRHWIQVVVLLIIFDHFPMIFIHFPTRMTLPRQFWMPQNPLPGCVPFLRVPGLRPRWSGATICSESWGIHHRFFFGGLDMGFIHWPSQEPIDWRYRFHICLAYFSGLCLREYPSKIFGQKYGTVRVPPFQDPEDLPLIYSSVGLMDASPVGHSDWSPNEEIPTDSCEKPRFVYSRAPKSDHLMMCL